MDRRRKAFISVFLLVVTLIINTLGATGFINGLTQGEVSNRYATLITPSPYAFSIWGVLYALLIISIVFIALNSKGGYYGKAADDVSVLFWISCVFNSAWIISFSYVLVELSVIFIFGLVITLALICRRLVKIQEKGYWFLPLTFGLYTGWLVIATVVNVAAALVKSGWNGFGISDEVWAIIMLIVAAILVIAIQTKLHNAVLPLPIAWAYFAIAQSLGASGGLAGRYGAAEVTALAGAVVLLVIAGIQLYRNKLSIIPSAK